MKKIHTMLLSLLLVSAMLLSMVPAAAAADEVQWGPVRYIYERSNNMWDTYVLSATRTDLNDPDHVERAASAYDYETDGNKVITQRPTCTEAGTAVLPGGAKFPVDFSWATSSGPIVAEIPPLGHSFIYSPNEIITAPTYEHDGLGVWICERCHYRDERVLPRKVPRLPETILTDCVVKCTTDENHESTYSYDCILPIRIDGQITLDPKDDLYHVKGTVDPSSAIESFNKHYGPHIPVENQNFTVDAVFASNIGGWISPRYPLWVEVVCRDKVKVNYTVKHLLQKLDSPTEYALKETESLSGLSDTDTDATANTYEGFTAQAVTQKKIACDGSTVVEIRYDRNVHTLTFDTNGGQPEGTSVELPYGAPITAPDSARDGLYIARWEPALAETMPDRDVTYVAQWAPRPKAEYQVRHLLQELDNPHSFGVYDTEISAGYVGDLTEAKVRTIPGFTPDRLDQYKIEADGSTRIDILYNRNHYTLTWDLQGGTPQGEYTQGDTPFEAPIVAPTVVKTGYVFDGWDVIPAQTMPAENVTYTARWADQTHVHKPVKMNGAEPTPGSDGWKPYYQCSCGKCFEDAEGTREISDLAAWKAGDGKLAKLGYKFLEGMNASWQTDSEKDLRFTANGVLPDLNVVDVDGRHLQGEQDYTVSSGSTVVNLKAEYLRTLKAGSHTLTLVYKDGKCSTEFTIKAPETKPDETKPGKPDETKPVKPDETKPVKPDETKPVKPDETKPVKPDETKPGKPVSPKTGDESALIMWSLLSMASLTAVLSLSVSRKKRRS